MELFRYRHLALGCAGFILGLYVSYYHFGTTLRIVLLLVSVISALTLLTIYLITKKRSILDKFVKYAPLCFLFALSMLVSVVAFGRTERIFRYVGDDCKIIAEVTEEKWENQNGGIYAVKITEIDGGAVKCKALIESYGTLLDKGNVISVYGVIRKLDDEKYGFKEKSAYLDEGITVSVSCDEITLIDGKIKESSIFKRINMILDKRLENNLNSDTYALFSALLLGNKENLAPSVRRDFSRLGISHVLALSGMHLTLLTTLLSLALSFFKTPKPIKLVLLIFAIAFFVAITGFSDSCMRAAIMMSLYYIFRLVGKGADSLTSLFLSVTLILLFSPYHIFSVSLTLSFLSMLGCIVASKIIRYARIGERVKKRLIRYTIYTLITSFVVFGFTSAVTVYNFGEVSVFSPISNLVLVPIFTGFIYFAPFLLMLCGVPYASIPLVLLAEHSTEAIEKIIGAISKIRGISLPIYGFWQTLGLLGILAVFIIAMLVRRKYLFKVLAFLSVFAIFFSVGTAANFMEKQRNTYLSAFNFNDADYLVLEDSGKINIIDFSASRRGDKDFASSLASAYSYSEIEAYVLCSYSKTSLEYVDSIISWNIVRSLYLPQPTCEEEAQICAEILSIAKNQGVSVDILEKSITLCGAEFEINRLDFDRSAYDSVSISGRLNGVNISYLGAGSYEAFDYFTAQNAPNADVIIFGESGPKYKLEYSYPLNSVDYAVYMGESYDFASEKLKNATQDKEFLLDNDYVRIKISDT